MTLEAGTPPGDGVLAIGISASGATEETIEALARHRGSSTTVALTNRSGSAIERAAGAVVPMLAGDEDGGGVPIVPTHRPVAGLGASTAGGGDRRRGAPRRRGERGSARAPGCGCPGWPTCSQRARDVHDRAAERLSSAEQGALMLREGPRRTADACEAGDWLHVDVYLTKPLDYRRCSSPARVRTRRSSPGCGIEAPGSWPLAAMSRSGPHRAVPPRRQPRRALLTEVLVAELVAARWWLAQDAQA